MSDSAPLNLLLLEDDEVDRLRVRRAFKKAGVAVRMVECHDLASARRALASQPFDCALLDQNLPDGTGLDLLEELPKLAGDQMAAIMLTGQDDDELGLQAVQRGAQDFMPKAMLEPRLLTRTVRYAIERRRSTMLQRRLAHSERLASIGQLSAAIAHEINNPAAVVTGNLALLEEHLGRVVFDLMRVRREVESHVPDGAEIWTQLGLDESISDSLHMLRRNAAGMDRIRTVTRGLGTLAASDVREEGPVSLAEVLRTACDTTRNQIRHRATLTVDDRPVPPVVADRAELQQVAIQLLLNACDAIPERDDGPHRVQAYTFEADGKAGFRVVDTGHGVPDAVREQIFEPFFTTRDKHSGLGLWMARQVCRRHGGDVLFASNEGRGSVFTVMLPVVEGAVTGAPAPRAANTPTPAPPTARGRVLVVDDEPHLIEMLMATLEGSHEVVGALGGREALDILQTDVGFDCLICDMMMPEVDGVEVLAFVRERAPRLFRSTLICSGGVFSPRARRFVQETRLPMMRKPFSVRDLRELVDSFVRQSRVGPV